MHMHMHMHMHIHMHTAQYMLRPPEASSFVFVIDVSKRSVVHASRVLHVNRAKGWSHMLRADRNQNI